ncbi:MAG: Mov34/MPN/PAD-1 family protein [Bacteroidota bacterium]
MKNKTHITTKAYHQMLTTVGSVAAEAGGLLFGTSNDYVVQEFVYDKDAVTSRSTYTFNAPYLNTMIDKMRKKGLELIGFFHSHPPGATQLSSPDRMYFTSQFKNFPHLEFFVVPLMFPATDGKYNFIPFIINKDGEVTKTELELVPNDYKAFTERPPELLPPIPSDANLYSSILKSLSFKHYYLFLWSALLTGSLVFLLCSLWLAYQYMYHKFQLNNLIWTLVE